MKKLEEELNDIWIERIERDKELIKISDLYPYSKINLKKKRNLKKFNKNVERYVSHRVYMKYFGILVTTPLMRSSYQIFSQDLVRVEPINDCKINLVYLD